MLSPNPTSALLIIGNEILSGRTQDKNLAWLGQQLNEIGAGLAEVRVVRDREDDIIDAVNTLRTKYTYVFTTGGIGPTHDDITSECIAKAFGRTFERNGEAEIILRRHYGDIVNEARLTMADMPQGAALIPNPVSAAPGFQVENVYVMAGVPSIMQAMFGFIKPTLRGGPPTLSRTLTVFVTEGNLAAGLTAIQDAHADVEIGSYPFIRNGTLGTSLVLRSTNLENLHLATQELKMFLESFAVDIVEE